MIEFGARVVVVEVGDVPDIHVGDRGEVVGLSDDGQYVGVMIDRIKKVYTMPAGQLRG